MGDDKTGMLFLERKPKNGGAHDVDRQKPQENIKPSGLIKKLLRERRPEDRFKRRGENERDRQDADKKKREVKRAENSDDIHFIYMNVSIMFISNYQPFGNGII